MLTALNMYQLLTLYVYPFVKLHLTKIRGVGLVFLWEDGDNQYEKER